MGNFVRAQSPCGLVSVITTNVGNLAVGTDGDINAPEVNYTPTTPADWPDPDPTNVQQALDTLAAEVAGPVAAPDVTYTPTTPADWPDPDPTNAQEALDSLAAQVATPITAIDVGYTPTTPADWPDPDPTNVLEALDSLAAQVATPVTAVNVGYTPTTPADWGPTDPTEVLNALDQLAATSRAGQQANTAIVGPSDPITFTCSAITPVASGKFLVWGHVSADTSVAANNVCDLLVDGTTVIATGKAGTGAAGPFNCSLFAVVSLDNTTTHTFSIRADASAGNDTAQIGWMKLAWLEIGG